jgi:SAM-dependent methyltransferase
MKKGESCTYCEGPLGQVKYRDVRDRLGYVQGSWDFLECNACGSLKLSPFPTADQAVSFYPPKYNIPAPTHTEGIRKWISIFDRKFISYCFQRDVHIISKKLSIFEKPGTKILEIGCGNGNRLDYFMNRDLDAMGVDMSEEDVRAIQARGGRAVCSDIGSLSKHFEKNTFDVILSFDVFEHLPDLDRCLSDMLGLLKPGGWLIAGLPASDCYAGRLFGKSWLPVVEAPRHVSLPSKTGGLKLFERFGLTGVHVIPYSSLGCAIPIGNTIFQSASAKFFYVGHFNFLTFFKRMFGGVFALLSVPICLFENVATSHPSRFMVVGKKG